MSITVRLWSNEDLKKIKNNEDKFLTTLFLNASSFGKEEIKAYPYHLRKQYVAMLKGNTESITFYATDKESALKFLKAEYRLNEYPLEELREITYHSPQQIAELQDKLHRRNILCNARLKEIKELKKLVKQLQEEKYDVESELEKIETEADEIRLCNR